MKFPPVIIVSNSDKKIVFIDFFAQFFFGIKMVP